LPKGKDAIVINREPLIDEANDWFWICSIREL